MNRRRHDSFRLGVAGVALMAGLVSLALGQQAEQQPVDPNEEFTDWGRVSRTVIEPSHAGVWDGTWIYVNRDARIAMWIKTENDKPLIKLQYFSTSSAEGFETDWSGRAEYELPSADGTFSMDITKRDSKFVEGRWEWRLEGTDSYRREEADFRMYRTGDGRFFVLDFSDFTKTLFGSKGKRVFETHPAWTFRKASKRLVRWDELPF